MTWRRVGQLRPGSELRASGWPSFEKLFEFARIFRKGDSGERAEDLFLLLTIEYCIGLMDRSKRQLPKQFFFSDPQKVLPSSGPVITTTILFKWNFRTMIYPYLMNLT